MVNLRQSPHVPPLLDVNHARPTGSLWVSVLRVDEKTGGLLWVRNTFLPVLPRYQLFTPEPTHTFRL